MPEAVDRAACYSVVFRGKDSFIGTLVPEQTLPRIFSRADAFSAPPVIFDNLLLPALAACWLAASYYTPFFTLVARSSAFCSYATSFALRHISIARRLMIATTPILALPAFFFFKRSYNLASVGSLRILAQTA